MLIGINIMRGSLLMGSKMDMVSFIPSLINILAILLITCMRGKDNSSKMVKSMWVALEMDSNMGLVVCKATKQQLGNGPMINSYPKIKELKLIKSRSRQAAKDPAGKGQSNKKCEFYIYSTSIFTKLKLLYISNYIKSNKNDHI